MACQILSLAKKEQTNYQSWGWLSQEWHLLAWIAWVAFDFGVNLRCIFQHAVNHPWNFQMNNMFPPLMLVPLVLSTFRAQYQRSIQISASNCAMLDGGSMASHCSQYVGKHSSPDWCRFLILLIWSWSWLVFSGTEHQLKLLTSFLLHL